jgi:hypothetical protein
MLKKGGYPVVRGGFGTISNSYHIVDRGHSCRELFFNYYFNSKNCAKKSFAYGVLNSKEAKSIKLFFESVENRLKIPQHERAILTPVDTDHSLLEAVPRWWAMNSARRQLLTILLRAGAKYNPENGVSDALDSYKYSKETKPSINYFFDGHTKPKKDSIFTSDIGWVSRFGESNKYAKDYKKVLISDVTFFDRIKKIFDFFPKSNTLNPVNH